MGAYTTLMDWVAAGWVVFVIVGLILAFIPDDRVGRRKRK